MRRRDDGSSRTRVVAYAIAARATDAVHAGCEHAQRYSSPNPDVCSITGRRITRYRGESGVALSIAAEMQMSRLPGDGGNCIALHALSYTMGCAGDARPVMAPQLVGWAAAGTHRRHGPPGWQPAPRSSHFSRGGIAAAFGDNPLSILMLAQRTQCDYIASVILPGWRNR